MPAFANIVLNDGLATPVARTFAVKNIVGSESSYERRDSGVPIGYSTIKISTTETKDKIGMRRVKMTCAVPVLEAVSGVNSSGFTPAAQVAYTDRFSIEFMTHPRSTSNDRKDLIAFAKNLLALALTSSIVVDGEEVY